MTTIVMNMDGCDIAHEAHMLEEYREEVACSGEMEIREPDRERAMVLAVALPSAPEEMLDRVRVVLSSAFPKCP